MRPRHEQSLGWTGVNFRDGSRGREREHMKLTGNPGDEQSFVFAAYVEDGRWVGRWWRKEEGERNWGRWYEGTLLEFGVLFVVEFRVPKLPTMNELTEAVGSAFRTVRVGVC